MEFEIAACIKPHNELARLIVALSACRLLEGKSGVKPISRFDAAQFPTRFAAQIENFSIDG